jgi:hypothetical protein
MNPTIEREYRKQRAKFAPAKTALAIARMYERDYGWEPAGEDRFTREQNGFTITLYAAVESCFVKPDDGGHYVRTRESYVGHDGPNLAEATPLHLPATHFLYSTGSRDAYEAFFPDYVEDQYQWARTTGGMSRGVARDYITLWVTTLVSEYCSSDYVYYDLRVTASKNGIRLGEDALGNCDFINPREQDIFAMVEDHGMVDEAITAARAALEGLCAA